MVDHLVVQAEVAAKVTSLREQGANVIDAAIRDRSQAYLDGQADRDAWENWFAILSGDYRNGAEYWATVRNDPKPRTCYGAGGQDLGNWTAGCLAAARKLAPIDRRCAEPVYRAGWSSR